MQRRRPLKHTQGTAVSQPTPSQSIPNTRHTHTGEFNTHNSPSSATNSTLQKNDTQPLTPFSTRAQAADVKYCYNTPHPLLSKTAISTVLGLSRHKHITPQFKSHKSSQLHPQPQCQQRILTQKVTQSRCRLFDAVQFANDAALGGDHGESEAALVEFLHLLLLLAFASFRSLVLPAVVSVICHHLLLLLWRLFLC